MSRRRRQETGESDTFVRFDDVIIVGQVRHQRNNFPPFRSHFKKSGAGGLGRSAFFGSLVTPARRNLPGELHQARAEAESKVEDAGGQTLRALRSGLVLSRPVELGSRGTLDGRPLFEDLVVVVRGMLGGLVRSEVYAVIVAAVAIKAESVRS